MTAPTLVLRAPLDGGEWATAGDQTLLLLVIDPTVPDARAATLAARYAPDAEWLTQTAPPAPCRPPVRDGAHNVPALTASPVAVRDNGTGHTFPGVLAGAAHDRGATRLWLTVVLTGIVAALIVAALLVTSAIQRADAQAPAGVTVVGIHQRTIGGEPNCITHFSDGTLTGATRTGSEC